MTTTINMIYVLDGDFMLHTFPSANFFFDLNRLRPPFSTTFL